MCKNIAAKENKYIIKINTTKYEDEQGLLLEQFNRKQWKCLPFNCDCVYAILEKESRSTYSIKNCCCFDFHFPFNKFEICVA